MTPLAQEWYRDACDSAEAEPHDRIVYAEATDRRLGYPRQVVVGAVVDGVKRRGLPGVILSHLAENDTGSFNECGVSTIEHARVVIEALCLAWPELRREVAK